MEDLQKQPGDVGVKTLKSILKSDPSHNGQFHQRGKSVGAVAIARSASASPEFPNVPAKGKVRWKSGNSRTLETDEKNGIDAERQEHPQQSSLVSPVKKDEVKKKQPRKKTNKSVVNLDQVSSTKINFNPGRSKTVDVIESIALPTKTKSDGKELLQIADKIDPPKKAKVRVRKKKESSKSVKTEEDSTTSNINIKNTTANSETAPDVHGSDADDDALTIADVEVEELALDAEIDKVLEAKALKTNLSAINVKSIIYQVITNNMVKKMFINTLKRERRRELEKAARNNDGTTTDGIPGTQADQEDDDSYLFYEPKLTRSKTKELFEKKRNIGNSTSSVDGIAGVSCDPGTSANTILSPTHSITNCLWPISPIKMQMKNKMRMLGQEDHEEEISATEEDNHFNMLMTKDLLPELDDSEDDEYVPSTFDISHMSDDELSSSAASFTSDIGSPSGVNMHPDTPTSQTSTPIRRTRKRVYLDMEENRTTVAASSCDHQNQTSVFKTPQLPVAGKSKQIRTDDHAIGLRTRSKLPLNDTPLEHFENQFIPPDITTDMYDWGVENEAENEDYLNFLKSYWSSSEPIENSKFGDDEEEEGDPEYNVMEDEDDDHHDKEELRDDRAVKIPKKELNELVAELFDNFQYWGSNGAELEEMLGLGSGGGTSQQQQTENNEIINRIKTIVRTNQAEAETTTEYVTSDLNESIREIDATEDTHDNITLMKSPLEVVNSSPNIETNIILAVVPEVQPSGPVILADIPETQPLLTNDQIQLLQDQMRQHVQLLAQTFILNDGSDKVTSSLAKSLVADISERSEAGGPLSSFAVCNVKPAVEVMQKWSISRSKSPIKKKILEERFTNYIDASNGFPKAMAKTILESKAFCYPELLPKRSFCSYNVDMQNQSREYCKKTEDAIIIYELDFMEEKNTTSFQQAEYIAKILPLNKTVYQIRNRIRNLRKSNNKMFQAYKTKGILPKSRAAKIIFKPDEPSAPIDKVGKRMPKFWRNMLPKGGRVAVKQKPTKPSKTLRFLNNDGGLAFYCSIPKYVYTQQKTENKKENAEVVVTKPVKSPVLLDIRYTKYKDYMPIYFSGDCDENNEEATSNQSDDVNDVSEPEVVDLCTEEAEESKQVSSSQIPDDDDDDDPERRKHSNTLGNSLSDDINEDEHHEEPCDDENEMLLEPLKEAEPSKSYVASVGSDEKKSQNNNNKKRKVKSSLPNAASKSRKKSFKYNTVPIQDLLESNNDAKQSNTLVNNQRDDTNEDEQHEEPCEDDMLLEPLKEAEPNKSYVAGVGSDEKKFQNNKRKVKSSPPNAASKSTKRNFKYNTVPIQDLLESNNDAVASQSRTISSNEDNNISVTASTNSANVHSQAEKTEDIQSAFVNAFISRVRQRIEIESKNSGLFCSFVQTLSDFETCDVEICQKDLFVKVESLLKDYPDLVKQFTGILDPEVASELGYYTDHLQERTYLHFLELLEKWTEHCPQLKARILQKCRVLREDPCVTEEKVISIIDSFFGQNPVMIDSFKAMFPMFFRPDLISSPNDFEEIELELEETSVSATSPNQQNEPTASNSNGDIDFELVKLPEETNAVATSTCPCPCHDISANTQFRNRVKHCNKCCIKFQDGRIFAHSGRIMKPVTVQFTIPQIARDIVAGKSCSTCLKPKRKAKQ